MTSVLLRRGSQAAIVRADDDGLKCSLYPNREFGGRYIHNLLNELSDDGYKIQAVIFGKELLPVKGGRAA